MLGTIGRYVTIMVGIVAIIGGLAAVARYVLGARDAIRDMGGDVRRMREDLRDCTGEIKSLADRLADHVEDNAAHRRR